MKGYKKVYKNPKAGKTLIICKTFVAGEEINKGDLLRIDGDGKVRKAR